LDVLDRGEIRVHLMDATEKEMLSQIKYDNHLNLILDFFQYVLVAIAFRFVSFGQLVDHADLILQLDKIIPTAAIPIIDIFFLAFHLFLT
jgi:hypothetical protein